MPAPSVPDVLLSGERLWHPWPPATSDPPTCLDGTLRPAGTTTYGSGASLAVATSTNEDITNLQALAAHIAWNDGHVLASDIYGWDTLIVPHSTLTSQVVTEALHRADRLGLLPAILPYGPRAD